jgi:glycosyltransferase involved in cell wall biosynthesis
MRILIHSPAFVPMIGGLEINMATMADAFVAAGHEVAVWTTTPGIGPEPAARYRVVRRPGVLAALRLTRWCDVFVHANVSLRGLWPMLLVRRPWVVSHHSWYRRVDGTVGWQDRVKRWVLRFADASIAVSQPLADDLDTPAIIIPNAYRDSLFRVLPDVPRDRELVFAGRLVSDKGVDVLLEALHILGSRNVKPRLRILGDGPERPRLEEQARRLDIASQVEFLGSLVGEDLVREINRHAVMVVPSRYNEPFGIVALEGIASGCAVVGTAGGGLPEAIGPCGMVVPNGLPGPLAEAIAIALSDAERNAAWRAAAPEHLRTHTVANVTEANLQILRNVVVKQRD